MLAYRLMDTTSVQSRHGSFCSAWVVVFYEAVIEAFIGYALEKGRVSNPDQII